MADNSTLPVNSGTEVFANNDIGGIKYPRVKVTWGAAGTAGDTSKTNPMPVTVGGTSYETVAASQTDQVMGGSGAAGDYLVGVLIVPGTTAAGAVSIKDGAGSAITIFAGGGTTALTTLIPFFVPLGIKCTTSWKITTGANVTAIGIGDFT